MNELHVHIGVTRDDNAEKYVILEESRRKVCYSGGVIISSPYTTTATWHTFFSFFFLQLVFVFSYRKYLTEITVTTVAGLYPAQI